MNQIPYDGVAYIGLYLHASNPWDSTDISSEIASTKLSAPMEKDSFYCFSSFVNLNDFSGYKSSAYNVLFSNDSLPTIPWPERFNKEPDLVFDIFDVDMVNWTRKRKGLFADANYKFMHIGNFMKKTEYIWSDVPSLPFHALEFYAYYIIDSVSLYKLPKPYSTLNYDCEFPFIEIKVMGADSVIWFDGNGAFIGNQHSMQIVNPNEGDKYIAVYSLCNYTFTDTITIGKCNEAKPEFPNIITTNGDAVNDVFLIKKLPQNSSLSIYNRWGGEVYKADNYQNNWQGETTTLGMGSTVVDGTYFYVLVTPQGNIYKGSVTVVGN